MRRYQLSEEPPSISKPGIGFVSQPTAQREQGRHGPAQGVGSGRDSAMLGLVAPACLFEARVC